MPLNKEWLNDEHKALHVLHYGVLFVYVWGQWLYFLEDSFLRDAKCIYNLLGTED